MRMTNSDLFLYSIFVLEILNRNFLSFKKNCFFPFPHGNRKQPGCGGKMIRIVA